uniref:Uncharacterized protein n=1 Tax=Anguilla anguilla TaxID=7936 RepID=A0A0E9TCN8_ANGAN
MDGRKTWQDFYFLTHGLPTSAAESTGSCCSTGSCSYCLHLHLALSFT